MTVDQELKVALGELLLEKLAAQPEKLAMFEGIGRLVDAPLAAGAKGLASAAKGFSKDPRSYIDPAVYHGAVQPARFARSVLGLNTPVEEQSLHSLVHGNPELRKSYQTVEQHFDRRGIANKPTVGGVFMNPISSLSPNLTSGGKMRWILEHLQDSVKRNQAMQDASPEVSAAVDHLLTAKVQPGGIRLNPTRVPGQPDPVPRMGANQAPPVTLGEHIAQGRHVSLPAHALPWAAAGLGFAHHLDAENQDDRPYVTSLGPGLFGEHRQPTGYEGVMDDIGQRLSPWSPALGSAVSAHPYAAGAAGAGALGLGAYGLRRALGNGDDS